MGLSFPVGAAVIATVGFVLAAIWIDTIASELVSMLEYLGLLSGINHTVRMPSSVVNITLIEVHAVSPQTRPRLCAAKSTMNHLQAVLVVLSPAVVNPAISSTGRQYIIQSPQLHAIMRQ